MYDVECEKTVRFKSVDRIYFTTQSLQEQYMVSSGHNRLKLCLLTLEALEKVNFANAYWC